MSELEDRIDELEHENEKLRWQLEDLEARFEAFAKTCEIGRASCRGRGSH